MKREKESELTSMGNTPSNCPGKPCVNVFVNAYHSDQIITHTNQVDQTKYAPQ